MAISETCKEAEENSASSEIENQRALNHCGRLPCNSIPMLPKALSSPAGLEQTKGRRWKPSLMSGSQHTAMLRQVDNITAAELRGYFLRKLPKLTGVERARCERYIEGLAAFERRERNSTHPACTTLQ